MQDQTAILEALNHVVTAIVFCGEIGILGALAFALVAVVRCAMK